MELNCPLQNIQSWVPPQQMYKHIPREANYAKETAHDHVTMDIIKG